jgi:Na+/H+-translocating membrane pyrophosphatase
MNALYKACSSRRSLGDRLHPGHDGVRRRHVRFCDLYVSALVGLVVTFLLVAITEYYTGHALGPGEVDLAASQTGTRRTSSTGSPSACRRPRCR